MNSPKHTRLTPQLRVNQYGDCFTVKKNQLYCKLCCCGITFEKKSTVDGHVLSDKHKQNMIASQKKIDFQNAIDSNIFVQDLIKTFCSVNISLDKLNNSHLNSFLNKYLIVSLF